ncbi:hypothetical protein [Bacillus sp. B15-48]|uniref:hypothetical protein n=1 Tax=Bacillus sp. B15-48 TaxID=1548601 RepID=UPI00193F24F0|nr:hypothetical protein [Bacillus sp. B15-48]MBM4763189.1 hypothetical protein [Bacillus sp. B15-48]
MGKAEKVKAFAQLYELVNYYYENRDRPVNEDFNFFEKIETYCNILELDIEEFKKEFKIEAKL